jgi:phosphatidylglycerophosphatase A
LKTLKLSVVTVFGLGLLPGPRGTYGSLPAAILLLLWQGAPWWVCAIGVVLGSLFTVWGAPYACQRWPRLKPNRSEVDPSQCCSDELAGQFLTYLLLPLSPALILVGFVLFRLLDTLKPPPADAAEKLPLGWGILADDLIVAVYANVILWAMWSGNWIAWLDLQLLRMGLPAMLFGMGA